MKGVFLIVILITLSPAAIAGCHPEHSNQPGSGCRPTCSTAFDGDFDEAWHMVGSAAYGVLGIQALP